MDSEVVLAMLQKQSHGIQSYAVVQIGEIQQSTKLEEWYWIKSNLNIADCLSKGKGPVDICEDSRWQTGPLFLQQREEEWPVRQDCNVCPIPEQICMILHNVVEVEDKHINIEKKIIPQVTFTTHLILSFYKRVLCASLINALHTPTSENLDNAERFWILNTRCEYSDMINT